VQVEPAITTTGLTRRFPSGTAVDDLDLEVFPGEVLALLGPNGAGKTTTVRLLNGVLTPDAGSIRVLGLDPTTDGNAVRRRTGVLTENAGLDDRLTARENLEATARVRGLDLAEARRRVGELLERFNMADRGDQTVQGASTGQRKRLALIRALLHDPDVLFLDEPTSGLDPAATRDVVNLIGALAAEHGRTIVLCTHFLGEAGRLADRMAVLNRGRLRVAGRPQDIAASMWKGLAADLDMGRPLEGAARDKVAAVPGVAEVVPTAPGARLVVTEREVLARVVDVLVSISHPVYGLTARPPTLEDIYFAIEEQIATEEGRPVGGAE
jgi:ABC-2 type transport system ATP-binding protein